MRHSTTLLAGVLVVAMLPASACADGLLRCLPEEGHWALYRMSEQWEDGTEREVNVTLKSLGSEIDSGKPCTWLEIVFEMPDKSARVAFRFLTPDEHVVTGADPLGKALRVWVRRNDDEPRLDASWGHFLPRLTLAVPAQIEKQTRSDETESYSHAGERLECHVVSGASTMVFPGSKTIAKYRLLSNADVPFGVAAASVDAICVTNCDPDPTAECNFTRGKVEFTLTSMGQNASSVVLVPDEPGDEPSDPRETSASSVLKSNSPARSP